MSDLHTCNYHCERPGCIKAQRDELRDKEVAALAAMRQARDALFSARNVIDWYKYLHPTFDDSDDVADAKISAAHAALVAIMGETP